MAIDQKYGKLNIEKIGEDEPVFILRARDMLSSPLLHFYLTLCSSCSDHHLSKIRASITLFRNWQLKNDQKIPD